MDYDIQGIVVLFFLARDNQLKFMIQQVPYTKNTYKQLNVCIVYCGRHDTYCIMKIIIKMYFFPPAIAYILQYDKIQDCSADDLNISIQLNSIIEVILQLKKYIFKKQAQK